MRYFYFIVITFFIIIPIQMMAGESAKVIFVKGDAELIRKGKKIAINKGIEVKRRDFIITGSDGTVIIELIKGHRIKIRNRSKVSLQKILGGNTKIYVQKGGLLSKVKKLTGNEKYIVNTPNCVVGVRGTEFVVHVSEERENNIVAVKSGVVIVKNLKQKLALKVKENQSIKIEGSTLSKSVNNKWIKNLNWSTEPNKSSTQETIDLDEEASRVEYTDNFETDDLQEWEWDENE